MAAQCAAIAGGMYLSFWAGPPHTSPDPPEAYYAAFFSWTILVAFATAILTRLWDTALALGRRVRPAVSRGEQPRDEGLRIDAAPVRDGQSHQIGARHTI